jgi:hypothetical protein
LLILGFELEWSLFPVIEPWNNWNLGTLGTDVSLVRFAWSEAIEPFD